MSDRQIMSAREVTIGDQNHLRVYKTQDPPKPRKFKSGYETALVAFEALRKRGKKFRKSKRGAK